MNTFHIRKAALADGLVEPISIEDDGTIWLGTSDRRTNISAVQQARILTAAKKIADDEIADLVGG